MSLAVRVTCILGRIITDNIMVAYELLQSMKLNERKKDGMMAINLDLSKACDRKKWPYLQAIMSTMGFTVQWISLIMTYVMLVQYSVLVNGSAGETFTPSRGLK